jgi:hypothetical protein
MVATVANRQANALSSFVVTRAICVGGERVEVGSIIELRSHQGAELMNAGKVAPYVAAVAPVKVSRSRHVAEPVAALPVVVEAVS